MYKRPKTTALWTTIIAFFAQLVFCPATLAQSNNYTPAPQIIEKLYECKAIQSSEKRLECYDQAVGGVEEAAKSGEIILIDRAVAEDLTREGFGFNMPSLPKIAFPKLLGDNAQMDNVVLNITRIRKKGYSDYIFYTENGQVWEAQAARFRVPKGDGHTLHIRNAALDSYLAQIDGKGAAFRVKRRE